MTYDQLINLNKDIIDLFKTTTLTNLYTIRDGLLISKIGNNSAIFVLDLNDKKCAKLIPSRSINGSKYLNKILKESIQNEFYYYDIDKDLLKGVPKEFSESSFYKVTNCKNINNYCFHWLASDRYKKIFNFISTYKPDSFSDIYACKMFCRNLSNTANFNIPTIHTELIKTLDLDQIAYYLNHVELKSLPVDTVSKFFKCGFNYKKFLIREASHIIEKYDNPVTYTDYIQLKADVTKPGTVWCEDGYKQAQAIQINESHFPKYPKNSDLDRLHDELVRLNIERTEKLSEDYYKNLNKKYKTLYDKYKELEYSNDIYKIIVPKKIQELKYEGSILHHCVGSYSSSVANGNDIILFLRTDKNTPYVTINLDSSNRFRQIHGKNNCNISSLPDSKEISNFLSEWIKEKNLDVKSYKSINNICCHL